MMALTRPAVLRQFRVRLPREPAAAARARGHVRDVITYGGGETVDRMGQLRHPSGKAVYFTLAFSSDLPV
jgi:hypothetical protein